MLAAVADYIEIPAWMRRAGYDKAAIGPALTMLRGLCARDQVEHTVVEHLRGIRATREKHSR